jgi:hypothetical protein
MTKRKCLCWISALGLLLFVASGSNASGSQTGSSAQPPAKKTAKATRAKSNSRSRPDIVTAVKAAARKDCGCGECAARGCDPCHGKNCYYCVAKALVADDCGCSGCDAKGCQSCGPGCDVCKFHLAPNADAKAHSSTSRNHNKKK